MMASWIRIRIRIQSSWIRIRIRIQEKRGGFGFSWIRIQGALIRIRIRIRIRIWIRIRGTWIRIWIRIRDARIRTSLVCILSTSEWCSGATCTVINGFSRINDL